MSEEIILTMIGKNGPVEFKVQRVYKSDQLQKFCLTGGDKIMMVEKRLLVKRYPWKVSAINFEIDKSDEKSGERLSELFEKMEEIFFGKLRSSYRPPHERSAW